MKQLIIILIVIFSVINISAKDKVTTKNGNEYKGKVLKYSETEVVIKLNEDNTLTFPIEEIDDVILDKDEFNLESTRKPKNGFPVLGLTFGSPGGFNFTFGYYGRSLGARISAGSDFNGSSGHQFILNLPYYVDKNILISPSINIGEMKIIDEFDITYIGFGLDTHIYGFTASVFNVVSLSGGTGNLLLFELGYKYGWY